MSNTAQPADRMTGHRIARWRVAADMTQQQLADKVGRSRKWVSDVETGKTAVTMRADLYACAQALGVHHTDLTGQPERPRTPDERAMYAAVPAIRGALDDDPDGALQLDPELLRADVDRAMAARMGCDFATLAAVLPGALMASRVLAETRPDAGAGLFVRAAVCASLAVKPFGHPDLATRLAERADAAAQLAGDRELWGAARFALSQCALASGTVGGRRRSFAIAAAAADELGDVGPDGRLTWYGMLHLQAGLAAAAIGHGDDSARHLDEAAAAAVRIGADPWRMEPTEPNAGVWRVSAALELDPGQAPVLARRVDRAGLRTPQRRAHLQIGAGRGAYAAGDPEGAVGHFAEAMAIAPAEVRARPAVREIVGQMVRDARRHGSEPLRDLAVKMAIDPLEPVSV